MQIWKQRRGSEATYCNLINVFERAGHQDYADTIRRLVSQAYNDDCSGEIFEKPIQQRDSDSDSDESAVYYTPPSSPQPLLFELDRVYHTVGKVL